MGTKFGVFCSFMSAVQNGFIDSARKTLRQPNLYLELEAEFDRRGMEVCEVLLGELGVPDFDKVPPTALLGVKSEQIFTELRAWLVPQHPVLWQIEAGFPELSHSGKGKPGKVRRKGRREVETHRNILRLVMIGDRRYMAVGFMEPDDTVLTLSQIKDRVDKKGGSALDSEDEKRLLDPRSRIPTDLETYWLLDFDNVEDDKDTEVRFFYFSETSGRWRKRHRSVHGAIACSNVLVVRRVA